jgi:hypothetical protein
VSEQRCIRIVVEVPVPVDYPRYYANTINEAVDAAVKEAIALLRASATEAKVVES